MFSLLHCALLVGPLAASDVFPCDPIDLVADGSVQGELELRRDDQRAVEGVRLPFGKRVRLRHAATLTFSVDEGDELFQRPRTPSTGR